MLNNRKTYYALIAGCILMLCIAGLKWAAGLQGHLDVLLADEAEYLRNGLNLFDKIAKNWGPTYNLWYKGLSLFQSDPVKLYYLNYKLGAIAVGILLFIFLLRYRIHPAVAILIAFCYLFSDVNMNAWPRISNFVLILYLVYFILTKNNTLVSKLIWFCIVTFIAAFARPELLIIAEAATLVTVFFCAKDYKHIASNIPLLLLLAATAITLFVVYGKPADTYSNINRTYIAFCQHYAVAYRMRTHSHMNAIIEWIDFTKPLFGDCKTVPEILMKHMDLCIPHFLFNLKIYAVSFVLFIANILSPLYLIPGIKKRQWLIVVFLLLFIIGILNKDIRSSFVKKIKQNKLFLLLAFASSIPSIGMCIVIFPRQHYMMIQVIWLALLAGLFISSILEKFKIHPFIVLPIAISLLLISPRADNFSSIQSIPDLKNLCTQKFISFVNTQHWTKKHVIFSNFLNVQLLFNNPDNFKQFNTEYMLKQLPANTSFNNILKTYNIDIILMNSEIIKETRLQKDSTWLNLTAHPEWYQFKKVSFSNDCQSYLLIKGKP